MTDNVDTIRLHVKKIKCTSQESQTEQVSEKHIPVGLCIRSKSKESDVETMRNSSAEARKIMETEKVTLNDCFESSPVLLLIRYIGDSITRLLLQHNNIE